MKKTAKSLILTTLTLSTVLFAVDFKPTMAAPSTISYIDTSIVTIDFDSADDAFWEKVRESVMKDKDNPERQQVEPPNEMERPKEVERKPAAPPEEVERRQIDRHSAIISDYKTATQIEMKSPPIQLPKRQVQRPQIKPPKIPKPTIPKVKHSPSPPYSPVQPPYQPPQPPYVAPPLPSK